MEKPPKPEPACARIDAVVHQTLKDCLAQHGGAPAELCMAIDVSLKWLSEQGAPCRAFEVRLAQGGVGFRCLEAGEAAHPEGLWKLLLLASAPRTGPDGAPLLVPTTLNWSSDTQRLTVEYARADETPDA
jgi:hypothetical protein